MSAYLWAELVCEGDNCGENLRYEVPSTISDLRRWAKERGWQRVKVGDHFEDRCPDCTTCVVA